MPRSSKKARQDYEKAANIIRDAGGRVVGRTRFQKIAFLLELSGLGEGFAFGYRHYGPYSEELNLAAQLGDLFGVLNEEERVASWGGKYSIFTTNRGNDEIASSARRNLAGLAASADAVELELAATAAFLWTEGVKDPWRETVRRKPDKAADGRLEKAKGLYAKLLKVETPKRLPAIF